MSKRLNGEGSIQQRTDGLWRGSLRYEDPTTGEHKRLYYYGKNRTEVRQKLKTASQRIDAGAPVRDTAQTVGSWLGRWRTTALAASDRKGTTKANYATMARMHLEVPPFSEIPLDRLRASDIDRLILKLRDQGLSDSTVTRVFNILRIAFRDAIREGLIARSPMENMHQPRVRRTEAVFLSAEETRRILDAAKEMRCYPVLATIAALGLRKGEALALKWSDVDLENGSLRIRGTLSRIDGTLAITEPKTDKSRRTLALSSAMTALLKTHRKQQAEERLKAGMLWQDRGLVFTTAFGLPIDPSNVLRALKQATKQAGVKDATVHTLRHSAATAWIENGVNLKAVSELLGHADIRVTADVYGHVSEKIAREAMTTLSDVLGL